MAKTIKESILRSDAFSLWQLHSFPRVFCQSSKLNRVPFFCSGGPCGEEASGKMFFQLRSQHSISCNTLKVRQSLIFGSFRRSMLWYLFRCRVI